jgi:hypothetical protein
MGFVDVLAKLHNKYNNFDKYDLSIAIKIAAQYNHVDTLQFLCQQCGEIPNNIIEVGMRSAISFNQIDSLRVLFSNYSTKITQQFLYDCIQQSADLGNLGILHFLLLNTEVIPTKMHENLILTVCDKGDVQSLEILLSKGTVSAVIRDYAISKAQRENKDDICQMLGQAKISCESIIFPTEIETLARSGYYWKFYRSEIYSGKDKVFIFKADSSLNQNQLDQLFIEHFPAIEGGASTVQPVNTLIKHILVDPRLEQLYYHVYQIGSEKYYQTPDPETLKKQWEKNHQFPLSISVVKGIITDQEYAQSFLDHDLIISEEKEFMHDTTVHVINTLLALMNKSDLFLAYKKHEREVIRSGIAFIDKNQYKLSAMVSI